MRFAAVVAVVLMSGTVALAQKIKDTVPPVHSPSVGARHSAVTPPVKSSPAASASELDKIERQTTRVRSSKPVPHNSGNVATTPALDLGKNKPVRSARSPQPGNPNNH
jgi:hypothetical protein